MKLLSALFLILSALPSLAQTDFQKKLQRQLILAEDGDTIRLAAGTFQIAGTLSLEGKNSIHIQGAGMDQTVLSFKGQTEGAEGLRVSNAQRIVLEDFTVQDAKGDAIKTMNVDGITFRRVKAEWTGAPRAENGAYGLYPVLCQNVLIEQCVAIGASDAGIYVGQSKHIVVRQSRAYHNVAGIEIENSQMADVYDNEATENTGGILVFDLPDLVQKKGGNVRVFNNVYQRARVRYQGKGRLGMLFRYKLRFGKKVPDIIFDGIVDETHPNNQPICVQNNQNATFVNLDAAHNFKNVSRDASLYNCTLDPLKKAILSLNK